MTGICFNESLNNRAGKRFRELFYFSFGGFSVRRKDLRIKFLKISSKSFNEISWKLIVAFFCVIMLGKSYNFRPF